MSYGRTYWASYGKCKVGPFPTRREALDAFREAFPFTRPDYAAQARKNQICTGYGAGAAHFDLQWHDAKDTGRDTI